MILLSLTTSLILAMGAMGCGVFAFWLVPDYSQPEYARDTCILVGLLIVCWSEASFLLWFFLERRKSWRVSQQGIAIYKGAHEKRFVPWEAIGRLDILPFAIIAYGATKPRMEERLGWISAEDMAWLRRIAGEQMVVIRSL